MSIKQIEKQFKLIDQSAQILMEALDMSYLDALIETGENILDGSSVRVIEGQPKEEVVAQLENIYTSLDLTSMTAEDIRKSFQYAALKALDEAYVQVNHQMTPDLVGQIIAYFILLFQSDQGHLQVLDLGVGSGNLLLHLMNLLEGEFVAVQAEAVDIDETLLALTIISAGLQGQDKVRILRQDALTPLLVEPADIVLSDLPVGYYPDDNNASQYQLSFEEGHSFSHYLFIEQGLHYLKENGWAYFLVPSSIFQEQKAKSLIQYVQEIANIQAVIQLPTHFFKEAAAQKSLLVVQKKGDKAKQAKEVLFAKASDGQNMELVRAFLDEVNLWKSQNFDE